VSFPTNPPTNAFSIQPRSRQLVPRDSSLRSPDGSTFRSRVLPPGYTMGQLFIHHYCYIARMACRCFSGMSLLIFGRKTLSDTKIGQIFRCFIIWGRDYRVIVVPVLLLFLSFGEAIELSLPKAYILTLFKSSTSPHLRALETPTSSPQRHSRPCAK
jgi:hypothetical protein